MSEEDPRPDAKDGRSLDRDGELEQDADADEFEYDDEYGDLECGEYPGQVLPAAHHAALVVGRTAGDCGERLVPLLLTNFDSAHEDYWEPGPRKANTPLACPTCGHCYVHIATITVITEDEYGSDVPSRAICVEPRTAAVTEHPDLCDLARSSLTRGPIVTLGLVCELGCSNYLELRPHKGFTFAAIRNIGLGPEAATPSVGWYPAMPPAAAPAENSSDKGESREIEGQGCRG